MKFTIAYTLLFIYVIAAIVFWGYSLTKQAGVVYALEKKNLEDKRSEYTSTDYSKALANIEDKMSRRRKQYLGEGGTFLLITILASSLIYVAYYRQRRLSKVQQNFMLSITHELKTPIAGIKLNMQTMEKHQLDEANQRKLVQSTITESNRLHDLCNNILLATQLESKKSAFYIDEINLNDLLRAELSEFRQRYPHLHFHSDIKVENFVFHGESTLWKLVISNLLENARKYSGNSKNIFVEIYQEHGNVILSIKDEGIGIADNEKANIFKKFYRVGNEEIRRTTGTGLGLYLVRKIIDLYKYDIVVKNNIPKGSNFEITFKT